ncbi:putative phosphatidylglycerol/phosphatidylinositol transfer protein DDB_G0278295 isoform X2 [Helianthus annuus]|uniref:putative phosphatidylglycerol/phosphatidylinositol transfer protein DDB_G0278295 isoform X2 n=1 Tax=Helianthus annuus TaxID=4232 RepID=UPI001652DA93|nr:putative phosphatidylglycerol/phosphatidylinositol transfer protein DDB_G0278295 isoform X2 [Helianthus annuus]
MEITQIKLFIVLLYILSMMATSIHAKDFKYCNKRKEYAVTVSGVEIIPDPIIKGKETSFVISAFTDKPLSEGEVVIGVAYFGWSVYSETGDLCANISCPIPAGDFTISYTQLLPTIAPPGSYTLTLKVKDGNKSELTCIKFDFSIGFFTSSEQPMNT